MDAYLHSTFTHYESLDSWQDMETLSNCPKHAENRDFTFRKDIESNKKLKLWSGEIHELRIESIVISINDILQSKNSPQITKLQKLGGNKYAELFLQKVMGCRTGEIRVTQVFDLPVNYILHTVSPRFNPKYENAANNALYNCYRNSLMTVIDTEIKSVAFSPLHVSNHPFPNDMAIHLEARVIRRFLEKFASKVNCVVIQCPHALKKNYLEILPIYFPRNDEEEIYSAFYRPSDIGNECGQPIQPERSIRISAFPYGPTRSEFSDRDELSDSDQEYQVSDYDSFPGRSESLSAITVSGTHKLAQVQEAPALLRQSLKYRSNVGQVKVMKNYEQSLTNERRFDRLFRQSKKMDYSAWNDLKVFYQCGKDTCERPIFVVVEKHIPYNIEELKSDAVAFIIGSIEKVTKGKHFSIIYAHTNSENRPRKSFFMEIFELLSPRYFKMLRCMCILHASLYNRTLNWLLTTFSLPSLKDKVFSVDNLRQLYRILDPILLELPDFIYEYDKHVGGRNAYDASTVSNSRYIRNTEKRFNYEL